MKHCVLSSEEAGRLENWGIWPACKAHKHISKEEADKQAASGMMRFVGGRKTRANGDVTMVTPNHIGMWEPVQTTKLMGFRTWGLKPAR